MKYKSKSHQEVVEFRRFLKAQFEPSLTLILGAFKNGDRDLIRDRQRVINEIIDRSYNYYASEKHWIKKGANREGVRTHKWLRKLVGDFR